MVQPNHYQQHILLYAKGHYVRSEEGLLKDIGKLIDGSCDLPEGHTGDASAYKMVAETFDLMVTEEHERREFWESLFVEGSEGILKIGKYIPIDHHTMARYMLQKLANVQVNSFATFNKKETMFPLFRLESPNPAWLPCIKKGDGNVK